MHGDVLCDYDRTVHLLLLYMGIPAPGEVYPADPDSVYVSGYAGDREIISAVRYDTSHNWKNRLPRRDGVCDGSICI